MKTTMEESTVLDAKVLELNMGPQHPSTHGVLRVRLKLDGERVVDAECIIGYLHRGVEKISENRSYIVRSLLRQDGLHCGRFQRLRFPPGRGKNDADRGAETCPVYPHHDDGV